MKVETAARLVTIYINSTDQWHGRPLYAAIVQLCQELGLAGVTVLRAVEGFGAGHQVHTTRLLELSENLPVRVEVIDLAERIEPFLHALDGMIGEGLVTVCDVQVRRYLSDPKR
jgi:PII-like signaling protein